MYVYIVLLNEQKRRKKGSRGEKVKLKKKKKKKKEIWRKGQIVSEEVDLNQPGAFVPKARYVENIL